MTMHLVSGPFGGYVVRDAGRGWQELNWDGYREVVHFDNGWSASIINGQMSHGLWEVAIRDQNGYLCYETDLTGDVERFYAFEDALAFVKKIGLLNSEGKLVNHV